MCPINVEKICQIHEQIIQLSERSEDCGASVREIGTLEFLVNCALSVDNNPETNAAIAMVQIASRHPFDNGNKRTAFQVADFILASDGFYLHADPEKTERVLIKIASYECDDEIEKVEKWIKKNMRYL
jgi:death-on-curing protein